MTRPLARTHPDATGGRITHPVRVAMHFRPWKHAFWLALFHDTVEDGYIGECLCRWWPALDAITRREGEVYQSGYIPRCMAHPVAREVKRADLAENMKRCGPSLMRRYTRAIALIEGSAT